MLAVIALGLTIGFGVGLFLFAKTAPLEASPPSAHVLVVGPEAEIVWNATVPAIDGSALSVLQAASVIGSFEVEIADHSLGAYVVSISGFRSNASSGWLYRVERAGELVEGDRPASDFAVLPGDRVVWSFVTWSP